MRSNRSLAILVLCVLAGCQEPQPQLSQQQQLSVIDFGNFIRACWAGTPPARMKRREYWDYGCYCGKGGEGTPVDATDECCQKHDACWAQVKKDTGVSCYNENYHNNFNDPATAKATTDCSKWTFAESCSKAKHPTNDKPEEESCCKCDLEAVQCFQRARATYDTKYRNWSNTGDPGASCGPNKGKSFKCASGRIARGEACKDGVKKGDRIRGYWCQTTCNKPQTCDTSTAAGNAYARCVDPPAKDETCTATIDEASFDALLTDVDAPCTGAECDECPLCTADACTGNHAPVEAETDESPAEWPPDDDAETWPIIDDPNDDDDVPMSCGSDAGNTTGSGSGSDAGVDASVGSGSGILE